MFGKHHSSMYQGSMIGKGSCYFAVWGYVIANTIPCRTTKYGAYVELNPALLAFIFGEEKEKIVETLQAMCEPDAESRTKTEEGRKLLKLGEYAYDVVNFHKYRARRDEEQRREQCREAKRRERARKRAAKDGGNGASTLAGVVRAAVDSDPITIADEAAVRELREKEGAI